MWANIRMKNNHIKRSFGIVKEFGLLFSIKYFVFRILKKDKQYIDNICAFLKKENSEIINKYNDGLLVGEKTHTTNNNVWVCWWQGYEKMPPLCRMCFDRLKEKLPEGSHLVLVTLDNYLKYASIPDVIVNKFKQGKITMTTYSDILRNYLIRDNGGLWIDSSVFVSNSIQKSFLEDTKWWSINTHKDNEEIDNLGQKISERKWSGFLQKGEKGNILNSYLCDSFLDYYKKHDYLVDYFIQNFYIRVAYYNIPGIKKTIDSISLNNEFVYELYNNIDACFEEDLFKKWNKSTTFYKLTQKREYSSCDEKGDLTFYGAIEKMCKNDNSIKK